MKHIAQREDGLVVRLMRRGVTYRAFVPASFAGDAMAEAVRWREHFLRIAGPRAISYPSKARSNTGIIGVSETTTWRKNHPYHCFSAQFSRAKKLTLRKFVYRSEAGRESALKRAVAWRDQISTAN